MNAATLINQTSGIQEYYTPSFVVEAARKVMGRIGLDPASSEAANKIVKADAWFGPEDHSLERGWCGPLWMNHPFGRKENPLWINRLIASYQDGTVDEACCITYACTSEKWFQPLLRHLQCFLCPRTNYYLPDGSILKGVTKGSVVTYLGPNESIFRQHFKQFGVVK